LGDFLKYLVAARVAGVGVDEEERLDFRHAGDDTPDSDELAEVLRADGADGEIFGIAGRAKVYAASLLA
jgi:hypothetical protein